MTLVFSFCYPSSFKKTWGCGAVKTEKDIAAYNVIREQHRLLGPMTFGEISVLGLFILLVVMWFTRDPGFVDGWATDIFNSKAEFVYKYFLILNQICPSISFQETFPYHSTSQVCDGCHSGDLHCHPSLCSAC